MFFKTNNCHKYNHLEFCFSCDTQVIPQSDLKWLIQFLENEVRDGVKFKDGETLQLGLMINQIQLMSDGLLHILEPNMKDAPIIFIDSLTNTLKYLRRQKDTVESCKNNIRVDFSSIILAIVVSNTYIQAQDIVIFRERPEEHLSGWFFQDLDNDNEENYQVISLYEFACNRPDLINYLAFPVGFRIYITTNSIIKIFNQENKVSIKSGSFLDNLNQYRLNIIM